MLDEARKRGYLVVLSAGAYHLKLDLVCFLGGLTWWKPWELRHQLRQVQIAARRAYAFHNLAIAASHGFDTVHEEWIWMAIDHFEAEFSEYPGQYRAFFEKSLAGEPVDIIRPGMP